MARWDEPARERLAVAMTAARRVHLGGISQRDAAARAGLSERTWRNLEAGVATDARGGTYAAVEVVLGWEPGTAERILSGDPAEVRDREPAGPPSAEDTSVTAGRRSPRRPWAMGLRPDAPGPDGQPSGGQQLEIIALWAEVRAQRAELQALRATLGRLESLLLHDRAGD